MGVGARWPLCLARRCSCGLGGECGGDAGWLPVSEPGGEVVAGAVVGGDERNERGAGLVGVVVDGLALEADGSRAPVPESLFEVVMH